jgi:lipoprotein-releasing system permease protein
LNNNFFIAYRLIKSKRYNFFSLTTIISILGISVSVAILILSLQILDGFENTIFSSAAKIDSQIKITGYGRQNLNDNEKIETAINKTLGKNLAAKEKFISKYAVVKSKTNSDGAIVTGVSGKKTLANLRGFLTSGEVPAKGEIALGKTLAEKLAVKPGDKITIFALRNDKIPDAENPPNIVQYTVSGVFETGMPYYDNSLAFISFADGRELFGMNEKISGWNIFLNTTERNEIELLAERLRKALPYPYYARSIFSIHRNIFIWLELQKKPIPVVLSAIVLVAALNIVGALFLLVLQRKKTIGILRTLGYKKSQIGEIFLFQGGAIATLGIFGGIILAAALTYAQNQFQIVQLPGDIYFIDKLTIASKAGYYILVSFATAVIALLISLVPSRFAKQISPVNAIRGN